VDVNTINYAVSRASAYGRRTPEQRQVKKMVQQLEQNIEKNQQSPLKLEDLLRCCVVKLTIPHSSGHGTGFFVAPELILTCAHVVKAATQTVLVLWQEQTYQAIVAQRANNSQNIDLALLQLVDPISDHPCVLLDASIEPRDFLWTYGYSDDYPDGAPTTFEAEGLTTKNRSIKFKNGQVRSGLSGAPLLNHRTGKVCGVIKSTRSISSSLGGDAVPVQTVLSEFAALAQRQDEVQARNPQWMQCIPRIITDEISFSRTACGVVAHGLLTEQNPPVKIRQPSFKLRKSYSGLLDRQTERDRLLTALQQQLSAEIYGTAGSGKTTLLEYLGDRSQTDALFPHGILNHRLSATVSVNDLLQNIFDCFCDSNTPIKVNQGTVQRYLQNQQALILLDDAELPKDDLKALMASLPDCSFLFASPNRRLVGEAVTAVGLTGLPLADTITLIERVLQRSLTSLERSAAEALYTLLEGHPGSILQAVASMNEQRSLPLIVKELQTTPFIRLVLMSLEKRQRWLVALLAVLGGFLWVRHANALTLLQDTEPILNSLVKRHIVESDGDRYRLAENIAQAMQSFDLAAWRSRALEYFTEWASYQNSSSLLADQAVLMRLLDWAVETGHCPEALSLVRSLDPVLFSSGQWDAWQHVLQYGLQIAQLTGDVATEAWILHQLGTRALGLHETEIAQQHLTDAIELRQSLGDAIGASISQHNLDLLLLPVSTPDHSDPSTPIASPLELKLGLWLVGAIAVILTALLISRIFWPTTNNGESPATTVSSDSSSLSTTPTATYEDVTPLPTNFSAQTLTATEVRLSWTTADNVSQVKLERSVDNGINYQQVAIIPSGATTTIDRSLTPNTTYFYRIRAFNPDTKAHSSYSNPIQATTLSVSPQSQRSSLIALALPREIIGGNSSRGRLRLNQPAPERGVSIQLESDSPIVSIPAQITIPAGEIEESFSIRTTHVSTTTSVTLTATQQGSINNTQVARILITTSPLDEGSTEQGTESPNEESPNPAPASLQTFTLSANSLEGGTATRGEVQLNNPASTDGVTILIESSNSNAVKIPYSVTIPAGENAASFDVATSTVQDVVDVTITARDQQGNVRSQLLRLEPLPLPPPAADLSASIDFNLQQQGRFSGVVQIIGYVTNLGEGIFEPQSGQAIAILYENNQAVSRRLLESITSGDRVSVEYTREWNASSSAEGEFPPTYRLVINNANDSNPGNDIAERSGSEINQRFSTQPNNSDTGVILRPNIDLDSDILQQPPDSPVR